MVSDNYSIAQRLGSSGNYGRAQQLGQPFGFAGAMRSQGLDPTAGFQYPQVTPQPDGSIGFSSLFQGRDLPIASQIAQRVERVPYIGGTLEKGVSELASPINIAIAALGTRRKFGTAARTIPQIIRGAPASQSGLTRKVRGVGASALESISQGTFSQRLASEALIGTGAETAMEKLELPGYLGIAEPILGGAVGLVGLRYGQKTKLGKQLFGQAPVTTRKILGTGPTAVDNHALTFGGTREPSSFGQDLADFASRFPLLADFALQPAHYEAVRPIQAEFKDLSRRQSDRLRNLTDDLNQEGHLFFDINRLADGSLANDGTRIVRGIFDIDQLRFFDNRGREIRDIRRVGSNTEIKEIKFKNEIYNDDVEKVRNYIDNLTKTVDEEYGVKYREIVNEDNPAPKLLAKDILEEGTVPLGEVLERHTDFSTYFPRVASFGEQPKNLRNNFKTGRVDSLEDEGYFNMFEMAEQAGKRYGEYWYTDPEGLLETRTFGSLRAAERKQVADALASFGATSAERLDPNLNPIWRAVVDKVTQARSKYKANQRQIQTLTGEARGAKQYEKLITRFSKLIDDIVDSNQAKLDTLDDSAKRGIDGVIEGIGDLRREGDKLRVISEQISAVETSIAFLKQSLPLPKVRGQLGGLTRRINNLKASIETLEKTGLEVGKDFDVQGDLFSYGKRLEFIKNQKAKLAEIEVARHAKADELQEILEDVTQFEAQLDWTKHDKAVSKEEISSIVEGLITNVRTMIKQEDVAVYNKISGLFDKVLVQPVANRKKLGHDKLVKLIEQRKADQPVLKEELNRAIDEKERVRKGAVKTILDEGREQIVDDIRKMFPALEGKFFTPEQKRSIEALVRADYLPTESMRRLYKANSFMRGSIATFDLSWAMIQGWALMFSRPPVFMQVMKTMLNSVAGTPHYIDYTRANKDTITEAVGNGLIWHDDYLRDEVLGQRPLEGAVDQLSKFIGGPAVEVGKVVKTILRKSDAAFTQGGNVGRLELYKALTNVDTGIASLKGSKKAIKKKAVADAANQLTGVSDDHIYNIEKIGVFAPRYTRNMFKNIFDTAGVSNHPERAKIVRETMLTALVSSSLIAYLANSARGEETDFNPVKTIQGGKVITNPYFLVMKNVFG